MALDCSDVDELDAFLRDVFPARGAHASMEYVSTELRGDIVSIVIRLVLWRTVDEKREITDIKEQQCVFAKTSTPLARFRGYLEAWVDVLTRAFEADDNVTRFDVMMPHDLVKSDVLALKTAHTKEDFVKALLQRSRLGGWLSSSTQNARDDDATAPPEPPLRDDSL